MLETEIESRHHEFTPVFLRSCNAALPPPLQQRTTSLIHASSSLFVRRDLRSERRHGYRVLWTAVVLDGAVPARVGEGHAPRVLQLLAQRLPRVEPAGRE